MLLERFLEGKNRGFYVDVGAHHPKRFSNTYRLYRHGWRGLNIDAMPGSMSQFKRTRSRDVNVEAAVASGRRDLTFFVFTERALNTFDSELARQRSVGPSKIVRQVLMTTQPLSDLLDKHVPGGTEVDVLNIDVEGYDLEVLESNDWTRYKPTFVLAECPNTASLEDALSHPISLLLFGQGYRMVGKTMNTAIFKTAESTRSVNVGTSSRPQ